MVEGAVAERLGERLGEELELRVFRTCGMDVDVEVRATAMDGGGLLELAPQLEQDQDEDPSLLRTSSAGGSSDSAADWVPKADLPTRSFPQTRQIRRQMSHFKQNEEDKEVPKDIGESGEEPETKPEEGSPASGTTPASGLQRSLTRPRLYSKLAGLSFLSLTGS